MSIKRPFLTIQLHYYKFTLKKILVYLSQNGLLKLNKVAVNTISNKQSNVIFLKRTIIKINNNVGQNAFFGYFTMKKGSTLVKIKLIIPSLSPFHMPEHNILQLLLIKEIQ